MDFENVIAPERCEFHVPTMDGLVLEISLSGRLHNLRGRVSGVFQKMADELLLALPCDRAAG